MYPKAHPSRGLARLGERRKQTDRDSAATMVHRPLLDENLRAIYD
jgi:hypothetical protein